MNMLYLAPIVGVLALLFAAYKASFVSRQDAGNERMKEISSYISEGAMAFLTREYKALVVFVVVLAIILAVGLKSIPTAICFIVGAIFSVAAGYVGMKVATKANVRTTNAAWKGGLGKALDVAFSGGVVMGMCVVGLKPMKLKSLIITSALLLAACGYTQAQSTQVIAHRGFWKTDGSAQNSIAALVKADSINCYGSEFDVWLTADNQLVVNHDSTFKGVNMQKSTAQQCTAVILDNGEQLPTLRQYLEKAGQLKTRLILELKSHKTPEQETRAVESIVKMVKDMGLENRMEYIAFSRHATKEFIRLTPKGTPVYYLEGDLSPKELKEWGCAGPDYHFSVFKRHPEWIKESHDLGMKVNAWTINDAKDMKWLIDHGVDFITTNVPVELQEILQ